VECHEEQAESGCARRIEFIGRVCHGYQQRSATGRRHGRDGGHRGRRELDGWNQFQYRWHRQFDRWHVLERLRGHGFDCRWELWNRGLDEQRWGRWSRRRRGCLWGVGLVFWRPCWN